MLKCSTIQMAILAALLTLSSTTYAKSISSFDVGNKDATFQEGSLENPNLAQAIYWGNKKTLTVTSDDITATAKINSIFVGTESTVNILGQNTVVLSSGSTTGTSTNINALRVESGSTLNVTGTDIVVKALSDGSQAVNAIKADLGGSKKSSTIRMGDEKTNSIYITASGSDRSYGILNFGSVLDLEAADISITSSGHGVGNNATSQKLALDSDTKIKGKNVVINAKGYGLTNNESQMLIEADTLSINSGMGIHVGNNTEEKNPEDTDRATTIIKANQTTINADTHGILAFSNGLVDIAGNLTVNAPIAIDVRGYSTVNINQDGQGTVVLNGNINFETPGGSNNSGNIIDAYVNIDLSGPDSSWTGNVSREYPETAEGSDTTKVTGLSLTLSDGAQWNPTIVDNWESEMGGTTLKGGSQSLNVLKLNDGVINVRHGADQVVEIENLTGTGGTINLTAKTDGKTVESGTVSVETTAKNTRLSVRARGITADDVDDAQSVMESLNAKVDAQAAKTNIVQEGDIKGEMRMNVTADNKASDVQIQENTKLLSMKGVNAAALVAWRDEVAYTNQRMEFLRDNSHAYGAWAQVYGGESAYDDASVDLTTTTVQVGADATIGDWVAGAAFSYMNGDADMNNGQADTDAYTLSLYASRMFDSGLFVNGLARYGRLSTDATAGNMDGSYDNNAFSLGGNVGYRFTFAEQAFVEPMFGLQYAYVTGDDYKASNGVKVEQDDFDALIASLGVRTGFDFAKDAGKLYARASVNHDFLGEVDGTASNDKAVSDMYVDLGGTWFTYGVGTQFNITDNLSVWGNVDRTTGGEVSTRYMMNAGLRYVF